MAEIKTTPKKVFLSYTKTDKDFARRLATDIETLGFAVWFDEWELHVGDSIIQRVEKGIQQAQWMIVLLSPEAMRSEWVRKELRSGLTKEIGSKKVFVLPALCEEVKLPGFLQDKFYADFTDSYEAGLSLLTDRLLGKYKTFSKGWWLLINSPLPDEIREELTNVPVSRRTIPKTGRSALSHSIGAVRKKSLPTGAELWFGRTGRLVLRSDGDRVFGDYDWHGISLAGRIEGQREKRVIVFTWDWRLSSERGQGLFWTDIPNVLHGGWWMDYNDIDQESIRRGQIPVPNEWEFVNVQGLQISTGEPG